MLSYFSCLLYSYISHVKKKRKKKELKSNKFHNVFVTKSVVLTSAFSTALHVLHFSKRQISACCLSEKRGLTSLFDILLSFGNGRPQVTAVGLLGVAVLDGFRHCYHWLHFSSALDLAP